MASIMIFGTLVGVLLSEWKGVSQRTHNLMKVGLAVLVLSTVVIGYGNYLKETTPITPPAAQVNSTAQNAPTAK
jgi:L-rhamnose-H+ transport protein